MIRFAIKITHHPDAMTKSDLTSLREAGFSDEAIVHITEIAAYFNFVNRLAQALGAEIENG